MGSELATFGATQNLNSQNPLGHGEKKLSLTLVEMNNTFRYEIQRWFHKFPLSGFFRYIFPKFHKNAEHFINFKLSF